MFQLHFFLDAMSHADEVIATQRRCHKNLLLVSQKIIQNNLN